MDNETLVKLIQQGQDVKENMGRLYEQNKGLIYRIIKKYAYIDCMTDTEDLMQQAYIFLVEAVEGYEPRPDALFFTYAAKVIGGKIKRYLDETGRSMRIPVHMQEKIYKYHQIRSHFLGEFDREPTDQEYRLYMELSEKQLASLRKYMHITTLKSIEEPIGEELTISDTIVDSGADMETVERDIDNKRLSVSLWEAVGAAISNAQDLQVLEDRYKDGCTLKECGERQGVTIEAARTREKRAMRKLRSNRKIREIGEAEGIIIRARKPKKRREYRSMTWADLTDTEREYMAGVM